MVPQGEPVLPETPLPMDATEVVDEVGEGPCFDTLHEFWGYRYSTSVTQWIVGDGDQFGMVSLGSDHYQSLGLHRGLSLGAKVHFLAGPATTDMPPRVFDLSAGFQRRHWQGEFGYDIALSVMASTDFEGSVRRGIRFPGHAVGFLRVTPAWDIVLGIDYLDRGDVQLLPVAGLIVMPHRDVRLELVFPRPRIVLQLTEKQRLSIGGELGGSTWAIERDTLVNDLATYRDLRLSVGLEDADDDGEWSAFEVAYLFDRRLEYTSRAGDYRPRDAVMIVFSRSY
jgi:hypothetical protein